MRPFQLGALNRTPDGAKAALRLDDSDPDAEEDMARRLEDSFATELTRALRKQRDALVPLSAAEEELIAAYSAIPTEEVERVLNKYLLLAGLLGMSIASRQMARISVGFDWGVSEVQVANWASRQAGNLVTDINATTQRRLQQAVSLWLLSDQSVADLRRELTPIFGPDRAGMIAATETTRAIGNAAQIVIESSGVIDSWQWITNRDDRVCPVCSQNESVVRRMGESFPSGHTTVPAHVNCRCYVVPWVPDNG